MLVALRAVAVLCHMDGTATALMTACAPASTISAALPAPRTMHYGEAPTSDQQRQKSRQSTTQGRAILIESMEASCNTAKASARTLELSSAHHTKATCMGQWLPGLCRVQGAHRSLPVGEPPLRPHLAGPAERASVTSKASGASELAGDMCHCSVRGSCEGQSIILHLETRVSAAAQ